jgi:hypothetical protein
MIESHTGWTSSTGILQMLMQVVPLIIQFCLGNEPADKESRDSLSASNQTIAIVKEVLTLIKSSGTPKEYRPGIVHQD